MSCEAMADNGMHDFCCTCARQHVFWVAVREELHQRYATVVARGRAERSLPPLWIQGSLRDVYLPTFQGYRSRGLVILLLFGYDFNVGVVFTYYYTFSKTFCPLVIIPYPTSGIARRFGKHIDFFTSISGCKNLLLKHFYMVLAHRSYIVLFSIYIYCWVLPRRLVSCLAIL